VDLIHTEKELKIMKILKIENGRGFYLVTQTGSWKEIDKIDKIGLMSLVDTLLEKDVEMDVTSDVNLPHQAHRIIYSKIQEKLTVLQSNKTKFSDESQRLYYEEIQKYSGT